MTFQEIPLGDFVNLKRGYDLPQGARKDGNVPVVSSSGITGTHSEAKVKGPGVVTGRYGTLGEVFFIEEDYWPLNTALYVQDFKGNDPRFVSYYLKKELQGLLSDKAAVPGVDRNVLHLRKIKVALDSATQNRIVTVLRAYDDLIAVNTRRMDLLEQSVKLLFEECFVRFRHLGRRVTDRKLVPEGWSLSTIGDAVSNFDSKRRPLSVLEREKRSGPFPYHGAAGILDYIDGFLFDGRYLLVGEDGTVATRDGTPMLQFVQGQFWVSNHAHVLQGKLVSSEYIYCHLSRYQIAGHVTGVAQPKLTQGNLNRIPILIPEKSLADSFQSYANPVLDQIFCLKSQNERLVRARDLLLPRLMDGRIEV